MQITYVSIFPEIFKSFLSTSLIKRGIENQILLFETISPRDFCHDKHRQVDDTLCGGGAGLLMKAKPAIDTIEHIIKVNKLTKRSQKWKIVMMSPSQEVFCQRVAHTWAEMKHLIFVCARYEGIDYRFEHYMRDKYPKHFTKVSLGQFVTLGGEFPAMVMTEAIVRLIPGVIKEEASWQNESYSLEYNMKNIEHPQYTKPEEVYGYKVPEILLSGHHKKIEEWKRDNSQHM